jgi:maltooligosyltrehalose trehalohydrolase
MSQVPAVAVRPGSVRYELQVSTFTPEGSLAAATEHLDHLVRLGVDVVELTPEPAEAGSGLATFVAACHGRGLAVLLGLPQPVTLPEVHRLFVRYGLDGVRAPGVTAELAAQVESLGGDLGRPLALLAADQYGNAENGLHALLAGDGAPIEGAWPQTLADVLHEALVHAGSTSHGGHLALTAHHPGGTAPQRPDADPALVRVGATLLLTGPFTPMVQMGEEWGASVPRPRVPALSGAQERATGYPVEPAPHRGGAPARAGLDWSEPGSAGHAELLAFYQQLIALRRAHADLADPRPDRVRVRYGDQFIAMRRGDCGVVANLAPVVRRVSLDGYPRRVLLATARGARVTRDAVELPRCSAIVVSYN